MQSVLQTCARPRLSPLTRLDMTDWIVYIGDGSNDVCPSLSLSSNDVVVARKGFPLAKHVNDSGLLKATLHVVDFNEELVETVQEILL